MPSKKQNTKGSLDMFFTPNLMDIVKGRKEERDQGRQKTLNEMCREELRNKAFGYIARFFYDNGSPFSLLTLDTFISCVSLLVNLVRIKTIFNV